MKTFILILMSCVFMNALKAQEIAPAFAAECPPGTRAVLVNSCDGFNFHRPITACESGFWFCFYGCTGWHIECRGAMVSYKATAMGNSMKVWGEVKGDKIELHFPAALLTTKGYTKEDLKLFSVDHDDNFYKDELVSLTMLKGEYPVKQVGDELVVVVNIK